MKKTKQKKQMLMCEKKQMLMYEKKVIEIQLNVIH